MNSSFELVLERLMAKWKRYGIACNPGATKAELQTLEQATSFQFDATFSAYLRHMNGFVDFDWDESLFSLWSTTRIVTKLGDHHPDDLICFADYSINAGSFGFSCDPQDPRIYLHYQTVSGRWVVADSFADFLRRWLLEPDSLLR
jgi:hypothetical protein